MGKRIFFASFVVDEEQFHEPGAEVSKDTVVELLASRLGNEGMSDFIVWESADDLILDHAEVGPITVEYLTREGDQT